MSAEVLLASLLVGLALQPLVISWLKRRGVIDVPNERSSHVSLTPRGGGIAVLASLGVGLLVGGQGNRDVAVVFVGAAALGAVGLTDDFRGLSAKVRLGTLLMIGAFAGLFLSSPLPLGIAVPALAVWTAAYVNAFNFMDGINGISGLSGVVAGLSYLLMGFAFESSVLVTVGAALTGACLSFLPYNLPKARVFLGDVGSYGLGFTIAASAWLAWAAGVPLPLAMSPTSVYLLDTGSTLVRRYKAHEPLLEAHRSHIYQRLVTPGRGHVTIAVVVAAITAAVVGMTWIGYATSTPVVSGLAVLGLLAAYYLSAELEVA